MQFINAQNHFINKLQRAFTKNTSTTNKIYTQCFVFCVVSLFQFVLFNFSFNYVVIPSFVIWYFPLGFQFIIFIFLPYRYWPSAILAICFASGLTMQVQGSIYYDIFAHFTQSVLMTAHTLPFIYYARERHINEHLFTLKSISLIVLLGVLTRFTSVGYFWVSQTSVYDKVSQEDSLDIFIQHNLAAYPGLMFAITIFLIVMWVIRFRQKIPAFPKTTLFNYMASITALVVFGFHTDEVGRDLLKVVLFLPVIYLGFRLTWFASLCCALWTNIVLLILLYGENSAVLVEFQIYIVGYFAVGLITAGLQLEHSHSTMTLKQNRISLENKNEQLLTLQSSLQHLSKQVVTLQEEEKKRLSQELHDDVGQSIIALRSVLALLEKKYQISKSHPELIQSIKEESMELYNNAYRLMHWLRPRVIDDFSMQKALSRENFSEYLSNNDIEYQFECEDELDNVSETIKLTVIRIIQECINNTVLHSLSTQCKVFISCKDNTVQCCFSDNGSGFPEGVVAGNYGDGLFSIINYVTALNGNVDIYNEKGARVDVKIPF